MRPSRRLEQIPPYLFAELERKVAAKRAAGIDVISLGIGDPDMPTYAPIVQAAGLHDASTALAADPLEELRMLAEQLLDGADERDLTEEFLTRPWPFPAVILANLTVLAGLDDRYVLSYPGNLVLRETETGTRVATGVILRRVPGTAEENLRDMVADGVLR